MLYQRIATPDGGAGRLPPISRLREATASAHHAVEDTFAAFMAAPAHHLTDFLAAQLCALTALRAQGPASATPEDDAILTALLADLSADLDGRPVPDLPRGPALQPEAVSYLTLGSRLGTEIIKRHLDAAGLPIPRAFRAGPPRAAWHAFRTRIDAIGADEAALDRLIGDARLGFALFGAAGRLHGFAGSEVRA